MLADLDSRVECVVGVDTHRDRHVLVVVDQAGRVVDQAAVVASLDGYAEALRLVDRHAFGQRCWAVEGSGSYGAGLTRYLTGRGERVWEVERPQRRGRDGRIKDDWIDARRAAIHVLSGGGTIPRQAVQTAALRLLVRTRESAVSQRTEAVNELRAAVVIAPAQLRERLTGLAWPQLVKACRRLRATDPDQAIVVLVFHGLARRIGELTHEADRLEHQIRRLVTDQAPWLLERRGVGPIVAAEILISWSHKGRLRHEACFARLAGVAPIPASSGQTHRHRLDRGGDRHLNRALHTTALTLARTDPTTQRFITERINGGKTRREAIRLLKRYLARSIYRHLETMT